MNNYGHLGDLKNQDSCERQLDGSGYESGEEIQDNFIAKYD